MLLTITTTKSKQIIDITDLVAEEVRKHNRNGKACLLFLKHTTAALTTADLDPGTDLDMLDAFEKLIPISTTAIHTILHMSPIISLHHSSVHPWCSRLKMDSFLSAPGSGLC